MTIRSKDVIGEHDQKHSLDVWKDPPDWLAGKGRIRKPGYVHHVNDAHDGCTILGFLSFPSPF